jgi:hypothetical protein
VGLKKIGQGEARQRKYMRLKLGGCQGMAFEVIKLC